MDFSRLHTYTPPQCLPENTGYTYALSSSYSSDALDFETEHKLNPVFDSPRMSRRRLHVVTTAHATEGGRAGDAASLRDSLSRAATQHRGARSTALSVTQASRKGPAGRRGSGGPQAAACVQPPVLDESLIREQTRVDHFWGLDDDGDVKGGGAAAGGGRGSAAKANGYTCADCSALSQRKGTPTACPAPRGTASRLYSRDRDGEGGASLCRDGSWWLAARTSASLSSLLVQLFHVVLMKLNCEPESYTLRSSESKDGESETGQSESREPEAASDRCGTMRVDEFLGEDGHRSVNGAALCDDCQGTRHPQTRAAVHAQPSGPRRAAGAVGRTVARAGHVLMQTLRRVGAAGGRVAQTVRSALQLALVAPGKAASGTFWWLGSGWYQFVTLISWLNLFVLTRCLRHICKLLVLLVPLLLLLGAGLSLWGRGDLLPSLPVVDWTHIYRAQRAGDATDATQLRPPPEGGDEAFRWRGVHDVQTQMAALSGRCQSHDEQLRDLAASLQALQARVDRVHGDSEGISSLVRSVVGQHLRDLRADGLLCSQADAAPAHREHESRISHLEGLLGKLTGRSEAVQEALEQTTLRTARGAEEVRSLVSAVRQLELELGRLRSELTAGQHEGRSCGQAEAVHGEVEAQVGEAVRHLLSDDRQDGPLAALLRTLSSHFVSKDELHASLRELELQILRNVTRHLSVTKQPASPEAVASALHGARVSGITEAQAHVIVNNALKLYSQDKTGMVDFALESGGGSILGTRCSETHETKTALISLFGIPLWYFSQSPRVVIQPDIYPGNCWAFKGSQGYLVVRLSMTIRPTSFTLEHIPKTLSPTGNITSAPKDFSVHGLENEYEEEGQLLGQFTYAQDGESLQTFPVPKRPERAFQIVELRILSNWGHPEYTCLYRFRVHGEPIK